MSGKFAAYRTPSTRSAGLKILVLALQSRSIPDATLRARMRLSDLRDREDADESAHCRIVSCTWAIPLCDFE